MRRRKWFWPVLILLVLTLFIFGWLHSDTADLWLGWRIPTWNITSVSLRFGSLNTEVTDRQQIRQLRKAILRGNRMLPYSTGCLPLEPECYSITIHRRIGDPIEIWLGVADDCGNFYSPSLDKTFNNSKLIDIVIELTGYRGPFPAAI